jgi:hypothetical protein
MMCWIVDLALAVLDEGKPQEVSIPRQSRGL